jgi:hypothetical protein
MPNTIIQIARSVRARGARHLLLIAAAALFPLSPAEAQRPVDLTLVLAVDVSDSIDANEGQLQREGYAKAFRRPEILNAIRSGRNGRIAVSYFEWADVSEQSLIVDWMVIEDMASAETFGTRLQEAPLNSGHFTSISAAITYGLALLKRAPYESDREVIDISGDGRSNDGPPLPIARQAADTWQVTINGLPIDNERSRLAADMEPGQISRYYKEEVITGPGAFIVVAKDFADFERAISRKLLREIVNKSSDGDTAFLPDSSAATHERSTGPRHAANAHQTIDLILPPSTRQMLPVQ